MPKPVRLSNSAPVDIDPVSAARKIGSTPPDRLLSHEPLRTWVDGLLRLKADRGRRYSWKMLTAQLVDAAKAAVENPKARVLAGGVMRPLTSIERETLQEFLRREYLPNTISCLSQESFPELWARVQDKRSA